MSLSVIIEYLFELCFMFIHTHRMKGLKEDRVLNMDGDTMILKTSNVYSVLLLTGISSEFPITLV